MRDRIWSGESWLYWLLLPLSLLYGAMTLLRHLAYRYGLLSSWRAPVPVVVVGNLTAGGSGKTPLVIWLVKRLQEQGVRVGVVSRGYGGKSPYYPLLVESTTSSQQAGDEPVLIFQRTQAPVAVAPRRRQAIEALLQQHTLDLIITDDGLQHYALQRDLELVVVDGERRFGNGWWQPAGPLREREGRLQSVDAVIINGGPAGDGETGMQLVAASAVNLQSGAQSPVARLPSVVAMAGIGYPRRFFNMLQQQNVAVQRTYAFADHHNYQPEELAHLAQSDETLLMTEKDAVKCIPFAQDNWWYLPVEAELSSPGAKQLIDKIMGLLSLSRY